MTIRKVNSMIAKTITVGLLAGAFALAAPKAQAQQFAVGVQVGNPHYNVYAPGYRYEYPDSGYYAHLRFEQERRREEWIREERIREARMREREFDRRHDEYGYGYRRGW